MKKFEYRGGARKVEDVVRRSKQAGGSYDSYLISEASSFKVKEGEVTVRIMPATWDDVEKWGDGWHIDTWMHYNVGPDNGAYLCLEKMLGKACPVCAARRKATSDDESDALRVTFRAICWVIDRDSEKAGPQLWSMPNTLFKEINLRSIDKKSNDVIWVDDPNNGFDISFLRTGTNLKTKYTAAEISREASPLADDPKKQKQWLDYIMQYPLPDCLQFYDAEHIEKVLYGQAEAKKAKRRDEEEEEEAPRRKGRAPWKEDEEEDEAPRRKASKPAPDEDEEERKPRKASKPPEDEDEEEEAPRPTRRRMQQEEEEDETPKKRVAAKDAEDEEEAEEAEDEAPSTGARRQLSRLRRG